MNFFFQKFLSLFLFYISKLSPSIYLSHHSQSYSDSILAGASYFLNLFYFLHWLNKSWDMHESWFRNEIEISERAEGKTVFERELWACVGESLCCIRQGYVQMRAHFLIRIWSAEKSMLTKRERKYTQNSHHRKCDVITSCPQKLKLLCSLNENFTEKITHYSSLRNKIAIGIWGD